MHQIKTVMTKRRLLPVVLSKQSKHAKTLEDNFDRQDPKIRGIHHDAIQVGTAPTGASACVACKKKIEKNSVRWGVKYAGNPLPIPVVPLYGSHPMVMWCHKSCGLAYVRFSDLPAISSARTCHACQNEPDNDEEGIRILCGGSAKQQKIQHHAFHIPCVLKVLNWGMVPQDIQCVSKSLKNALSWDDLTNDEKEKVKIEFLNCA